MRKLLLLLMLVGCGKDATAPCTKVTHTVDAVYGDTFYDINLKIVSNYESRGFTCSDAPLRNAFGARIGTTYTCTGCDS